MNKVTPRKAKSIIEIDYSPGLIDNHDLITDMRNKLMENHGFIIKNMISPELIDDIISYLKSVACNSLPCYQPLVEGCPDFHRINGFDPRSYVKARMHQFNFHPWNQNVFELFKETRDIYFIKNMLSGLDKEAHLQSTPKDGYICRLAFQFYPVGGGCIKKHSDPIGLHQVSVPLLCMSNKGEDYEEGGGYVINEKDETVITDDIVKKGDVLFFNAEVMHGVLPIDPNKASKWLDFKGRWIMIASTIKTLDNEGAANALQLED